MAKLVQPKVFLVAYTQLDFNELNDYFYDELKTSWFQNHFGLRASDPDMLAEIAGRICYRAWEPGLNPNVTKIRENSKDYVNNILESKHGSVLEHVSCTFLFTNVSRVFTHELVRHRAGCAISQESMRYVRLTDIPMWIPEWAQEDKELHARNHTILSILEEHQRWMTEHFGLDKPGVLFTEKKHKTSFMRRFAPDGVATGILWSANMRALRHVLEMRTALVAEEEIRMVFDKVGEIVTKRFPLIFQDFDRNDQGEWIPKNSKV